jgi:hypothetical protein
LKEWDSINLDHYVCPVHARRGTLDNLIIRELVLDPSGLICEQKFSTDELDWVKQIKNEKNLQYHSTVEFENSGDWRFQVEMNVDMLHVDHIHPRLRTTMDPNAMNYTRGNNWVAQYWNPTSWWGFIFPFYQFEYQPGAVYYAELIPNGFTSYKVKGHFYFDATADENENMLFKNLMIETYREDLAMVANMGEFYGPYVSSHPQEADIMHWHDWYWSNKDQIRI